MKSPRRLIVLLGSITLTTAATAAPPSSPPPESPAQNTPAHSVTDAAAQILTPGPGGPETSFLVYIDNDSRQIKPNHPQDQHYTNGIGIGLTQHTRWADDVADWMPGHDGFGPARTGVGYVLAQQMYTPEVITDPAPQPLDHPWAGYLYGGIYWERATDDLDAPVRTLDHFQLDVGLVGPDSLAEDTQIWWHHRVDADHPAGWANQIKDEPAVQFTFRKKWRFDLLPHNRPDLDEPSAFDIQLIPYAGFGLGTVYRQLEGGATLRAGWNIPDDFGPAKLNDPADATAPQLTRTGWSVYGFTRLGGRAVQHNLFIEGSDFRSGPGASEKPLVGEVAAGGALAYHADHWALELDYQQTFLTQEFKTQTGHDAYGSLALRWTCNF